jgi:hypothetical protein
MSYIPDAIRQAVRNRASGKCEYCLIGERFTIKFHECDHIYAEKHGGETTTENPCLCCVDCNRHKGSDLASTDPETHEPALLFHPRRDNWTSHFQIDDGLISGLTGQGRATVRLLQMNDLRRQQERKSLIGMGYYP